MSDATLVVKFRGVAAVRLDPAGGRFASPDAIEWLDAANALSCGWRPPIAIDQFTNWLEHLLPENGQLLHARRRADDALRTHGLPREASGPADILWGNCDLECPGAASVSAELAGSELPGDGAVSDAPLAPEDIGKLVRWAAYEVANRGPPPARPDFPSRTSLSGMRPKIGLRHDPVSGSWHLAHGGQLSTHIVKLEDTPDLPGEAVAESVSLRALGYAGIAAAHTVVRVWGGRSCLLSRRSDRETAGEVRAARTEAKRGASGGGAAQATRTAESAAVVARHQEAWGQAACLGTHEKFAHQRENPGWAEFHAMLAASSASEEAADASFVRALVGCALLAHTDLHRQNIGLLHTGMVANERPRCEIAPMYDVSCADGRPDDYARTFAIPIGGATTPMRFNAAAVDSLANASGIRRERARGLAMDIAANLPDAVEQAKRDSAHLDEPRSRADANVRLEAMARGVESRSLRLRNELNMAGARRSRRALR